ncbi:MAG: YesL family protein [Lachnospiraceae bacterium]|nr:YesL family protein [Lachnospiraceae bacterium]
MNFFNEDNFLNQFFLFMGKLIALNLLWMISCIPVITIGASTTALFYCTLKLHKDKDISTWKFFWKSFRSNFLQSTAIWILLLVAGALLWLERIAIGTMPQGMKQIFTYVLAAAGLFLLLISLYIFPTVASFENKLLKLLGHTLYFIFRQPGYAVAIAAITCLPMYFTLVDAELFPVYLFVWLLCGFSLTAYVDSWFLWRLFRPFFKE